VVVQKGDLGRMAQECAVGLNQEIMEEMLVNGEEQLSVD
jgi:hypothetical protein